MRSKERVFYIKALSFELDQGKHKEYLHQEPHSNGVTPKARFTMEPSHLQNNPYAMRRPRR